MKDPRLGLLLATSFSLLQYNCTPALSQTHQIDAAVKQRSNDLTNSALISVPSEHVLLFFCAKDKDNKPSVPAAALTIHPVLPLSPEFSTAESTSSKPTLVAMNGDIEGSLFDAAQKTQNEKVTESPAAVSDTLSAEPAAPEPTPIAATPHSVSDEKISAVTQSTVSDNLPAVSSTVVHEAIESTSKSQPDNQAAQLKPEEPQAQSGESELAQPPVPEPLPIAVTPPQQPEAQPASPQSSASQPETNSAVQTQTPELKAVTSQLTPPASQPQAILKSPSHAWQSVVADNKLPVNPASKSTARPPDAIFMKTSNDSEAAQSTPLPIASLPPIKSRRSAKQQAPEQLIAQINPSISASPIPPVVSGTIDLEEFKSSNVIDLKVSQSRTFRLRNKIIRTSISDPSIAEPVVVSESQMVLLGKSPGGATLVVWDDAGNSLAVDVHVERDFSQLQATLREIDPRIIVKPFSVGGSDRVILLGDVDHAESVIRAFSAANAFMDDRGMKIIAANSRLINEKLGEMPVNMMLAMQGMMGAGGGSGALGSLQQVNNFMYFSNLSNNVNKAQAMISDGGRVTSLIKVRKTPLIVLHCQFLEMNSAAVRELGIQLGMNLTTNNVSFGIGGQTGVQSATSGIGSIVSTPGLNGLFPSNLNAYSGQSPTYISTSGFTSAASTILPALPGYNNGLYGGLNSQGNGLGASVGPVNYGVLSSIPTVYNGQLVNMPVSQVGLGALNGPAGLLGQTALFGIPGGATFNSANLANMFSGVTNLISNSAYRFSVNPTINGIISHSRARVLAEPTLVTISGERAAFLAGGEIPIEQAIATAGTSQMSVAFEPFGLRLNMIPVLLENGTINLQVSPEERLLSQANAINLVNIGTIPGFTTRKLQTVVELKPGQELFISGLVTANSGRELDKTPILGEIPVLGALYRSKAFAKNESELVISVRPEIIVPGNPGQLKLPEEVSRSEATRDTNIFQVEPTIIDERYMTSGRAEQPQRIPGTLPPGAPLPDNQ